MEGSRYGHKRQNGMRSQAEPEEAEDLFDDADHRFDGTFACPVEGFTKRGPELVGHFDLRAGVLRWRVRQWREALRPSGMMGITPRGDVRLAAAFGTGQQRR